MLSRKRDWLLVFLVSLLLFQLYGVANQGVGAYSSGDDWPMFLHDPAHTGSTASAGPSEPVVLWRFPVPNDVYASAAVVNGVVYVGGNDNIYALDAYTGAKIWNYSTSYSWSSPAVSKGVVFIGADGDILALDASTGTKIWSFPTTGRVVSSPAVVDGVVYFGALDDNVYALKASTGEKIWNHTVRLGVTSAPAVSEGVVYISSDTYYLYALSAASGEEMWHFPTDADKVYASPAVSNGVLYVATRDGYFYAIVEPLTTPPPTPTPNPKEESFPIEWIIVAVAVLAVFGATLLVYFKKRKRYKVS